MKLIITEAHYKLLLEKLIDEAAPSEHLGERSFGRFLSLDKLVIGYDEGWLNFKEVGTVKKNDVIKENHLATIEALKDYKLPYNTSYGIKLENLSPNLKNSLNNIEMFDDYRDEFKERFSQEINTRANILKRKLNDKEVDAIIKKELINKKLLVFGEGSNGNQIYLVIRNNVLSTIFFGIDNMIQKNPTGKLKVDYYYNSFEDFKNENSKYETGEIGADNSINENDVIFNNKLMNKLLDVHTKIGQGSIFAKDLRVIKSITRKAIVDYVQNNEISGVVKLEINVDGVGYDLVKSKKQLTNYNIIDIKNVYKKEKDERTGDIIEIPVKTAIVKDSLSKFKTDKLTIIFTKGRDEGKYFVITVYPGRGDGVPKASQWGDDFYVIIPK